MVNVSDIYKDFNAFSKETGDLVWTYRDIFAADGKNEFGYNYQKIIDDASRKIGLDATQDLIENGILHPMALGEYEVNCGAVVKNGGGVSTSYGIFVSDNTDLAMVYHELAHAFQNKLDVFQRYPLQKKYDDSLEELAKKNSSLNLVDFWDYKTHLNEVHAEVFAYCAMMLRAENTLDFYKQATQAYLQSNSYTFSSLVTKNETNQNINPLFLYASLPAMKEAIKQIKQIRKTGQAKDYFDENGCLRGAKLAEFAAQIVYDKAYSPQAFSALTQKKLFVKPTQHERRIFRDAFEAYSVLTACIIRNTLKKRKNYKQAVSLQQSHDAHNLKKLQNIQQNFAHYKLSENDNEAKILNDVTKIYLDINTFAKKNGIDYSDISMIDFQLMKDNDYQFSPAYSKYIAKHMVDFYAQLKPERILADLNPLLRNICDTMKSYKDNPQFFNTLYAGYTVCSQKFTEKKQFPQKKVLDDIQPPLFEHANKISPLAVILSNIHSFEHLSQSFKANEHLAQLLSAVYLQNPQQLGDKKFQKEIINAYKKQKGLRTRLFGDKKFEKDLIQTIDSALYDDYQANCPELKLAKRVFDNVPPEKISTLATHFFKSSADWEKALQHITIQQSHSQQCSVAHDDTSQAEPKVREALNRINLAQNKLATSNKSEEQSYTDNTDVSQTSYDKSSVSFVQISKRQDGFSQ